MSKLIDKNALAALAAALDSRAKAAVTAEESRALAAEAGLQTAINGKANEGHTHDDRYFTESEINTKVSNLQAEIDADVKVEKERAMAAEAELQADIDNKADEGHTHDDRYFTETEITTKLAGKSDSDHTHDDRYYTETEIDAEITALETAINGKADSSHGNHVPATEAANNAKFLRNDNTWQTVTPDNIGAAKASHGTHVTYSTAAPAANGTASAGSAANVSRGDHVHPLQTTVSGNAGSATKLATARTLTIGSKGYDFDGTDNVTWTVSEIGAAPTSHNHDDRYFTESEINTKVSGLQAEIDADVKVEKERAMAEELRLQSEIDGKADESHGNHVPATEATNNAKFLRNDNTWATVTPANIGASPSGHNHDDRYFTETEMEAEIEALEGAIDTAKADAKSYADQKIAALVNSAPDAMNTLNELATAITDHQDVYEAYVEEVSGQLAGKSDTGHTHNYAGSASAGGAATSANKVNTNLTVKLNGGTTEGTNLFTFNGSAAKSINITPDSIGAAGASHGTHVEFTTTTPKANGTAAVGSATTVSRSDHVHPLQTTVSGNAGSATKLQNARTLTIGNKGYSFDGTGNITWTVAEIGASAEGHTHNYAGSASAGGAANSVKTSLAIKLNSGGTEGTDLFTFNGSAAKTVNITPSAIGAAASSHGTHVTYSTSAPAANGTASAGSATNVSRGDHVHPLQTTVSGNAGSATKLATARTLTIGNKGYDFNGTGNITWTLAEIGASAEGHTHSVVNKIMHTSTIYNATSGVLINFNMNEKSSAMVYLKIVGNSYNSDVGPIEAIYQFYDYATGTILQGAGTSISGEPLELTVMRIGGKLQAWFPEARAFESFRVEVSYGNVATTPNITLTNAAKPTTNVTETVVITPVQLYSSRNKPTPDAIGAANASHGTHVTWATTAPKANGTAAVGSVARVAREDHIHPLQTTVSGNAGSATKLATARTLTIGNKGYSFDGTGNVTWTLAEIGASATGHTHNYAGSASAGGAANSVKTNLIIKLNSGTTEGTNLFTFNGSTAKTINITPSAIGAAASSHGTHVTYSTSAPAANGTASAGSAANVARGDHVHPLQTSVSGNAGTATTLATARTLTIGNKGYTFNGSANVTWTLAEIGAEPAQHTVKTTTGSSGTFTLTKDKYQTAALANGNTIVLPTVTAFTEINLFVHNTTLTNILLPDGCKWRVDPNLEAGTSYMFTFIYTGTQWLAEAKIYS